MLAFVIAYIGRLRPFNSDDLYWQQVVRTWRPFSGHTLYFGTKDTFVEEVPFFALMEHVFNPSRKLLIAEASILTMASFGFFYLSSLYFLKKLKVRLSYLTLLPFIWLASFGYPLVQNYLNSDWRTFEIGLSFLTFVLVAAIFNEDFRPFRSIWTRLAAGVSIVLVGVLDYSDPYYIFFVVGPLILFTAALFLLRKISRSQLLTVFGGVALSLAAAKAVAWLFERAGAKIVFDTPSAFVAFDNIVANTVASLHGLLIVFGADFFGRPTADVITAGSALNAVILAVILYKAWGLRRALARDNLRLLSLPQLWMAFFGCMIGFVFVVYTLSSLVTVSNYRYFIILVYCAVTFLALALGIIRNGAAKLVIGGLLLAATLFNVGHMVYGNSIASQGDVHANVGNSLNYELIRTVESEGLAKGYASYWLANVNTYFSNGKVNFLPSLCTPDGKTTQFRWLIDSAQFDRKASKSFFLIDPDIADPPTCTREQLAAQFGQPRKILAVSNKTILVYDYDITRNMR